MLDTEQDELLRGEYLPRSRTRVYASGSARLERGGIGSAKPDGQSCPLSRGFETIGGLLITEVVCDHRRPELAKRSEIAPNSSRIPRKKHFTSKSQQVVLAQECQSLFSMIIGRCRSPMTFPIREKFGLDATTRVTQRAMELWS
jgi:hypothetical protein